MLTPEISTAAFSSATILAFPATIVAARVERERRGAATYDFLAEGTTAEWQDHVLDRLPGWLLNKIGELLDELRAAA